MKIFISVGHGGRDGGAEGNGYKESELNLELSRLLAKDFEKYGIQTLLSRNSDIDNVQAVKLEQIEEYKPDCMIDVHFNSGGGTGTEAYFQNDDPVSKKWAEAVSSEVSSALGIRNRGAKIKLIERGTNKGKDYFGMLRNSPCTSILLETVFIDSASDMNIVKNNMDKAVKAITEATLKTFGIDYEESDGIEKKKTVNASVGLWLLKAPATNAAKILVMPYGSEVTVLSEGVAESNGYSWDRVRYGNETGYSANKYLTEVSSEKYITMTVTPDAGLYYHSSYKANSQTKLGLWRKGTEVKALPGSEVKYGNYTWIKILYDGKYVWAAKDYLK